MERAVVEKYEPHRVNPGIREIGGILLDDGLSFRDKYASMQYYGIILPQHFMANMLSYQFDTGCARVENTCLYYSG